MKKSFFWIIFLVLALGCCVASAENPGVAFDESVLENMNDQQLIEVRDLITEILRDRKGASIEYVDGQDISVNDFAAYMRGDNPKFLEHVDDTPTKWLSFSSNTLEISASSISTLRGIVIGESTRSDVINAYGIDLVGRSNVDDRGDRYFITYSDSGKGEYNLRFFFEGFSDTDVVKEIDIYGPEE